MHHTVSKINIILEFLLRQLYDVKEMGYISYQNPVNCFPMEALPLLAYRQLLSSIQIHHLLAPPLISCPLTFPTDAFHMGYVVEVGNP